ncbi:MAG TPA: hypothetical protein VGF29_19035 [Hyphomicrobiaceae bacterium]
MVARDAVRGGLQIWRDQAKSGQICLGVDVRHRAGKADAVEAQPILAANLLGRLRPPAIRPAPHSEHQLKPQAGLNPRGQGFGQDHVSGGSAERTEEPPAAFVVALGCDANRARHRLP